MAREKSIALDWLKGCKTEEEKHARKATVYQSINALLILRDVLKNKVDEARRGQSKDFTTPAWSEKQAFLLGKIEALEDTIKLLPETDQLN